MIVTAATRVSTAVGSKDPCPASSGCRCLLLSSPIDRRSSVWSSCAPSSACGWAACTPNATALLSRKVPVGGAPDRMAGGEVPHPLNLPDAGPSTKRRARCRHTAGVARSRSGLRPAQSSFIDSSAGMMPDQRRSGVAARSQPWGRPSQPAAATRRGGRSPQPSRAALGKTYGPTRPFIVITPSDYMEWSILAWQMRNSARKRSKAMELAFGPCRFAC